MYEPPRVPIPPFSPGLHFHPLRACFLMPGWVAVQEALVRADYHIRYPDQVSNTVESACESVVVRCCESDATTLPGNVSLAATVCKLLRHTVPLDTAESIQSRRREFAEQPNALLASLMQRMGTLDLANTFVPALVLAVSALCRLHAEDNLTLGSASVDGGVSNSSSIDSGSSSGSGGNVSGAFGGSGGSRKPANDGRVGCAYPSSSEVHQLQAIICLTLVQMFRWASALPFLPSQEGWWGYALRACEELPWQGFSLKLRGLVTALLEESSLSIAQAEVNTMWERYAVEHFQGRLLPGCCHQGCTNLAGTSEAALKTLLCSGCRKARYCCLECQKAAWLEGGHSTVCRR